MGGADRDRRTPSRHGGTAARPRPSAIRAPPPPEGGGSGGASPAGRAISRFKASSGVGRSAAQASRTSTMSAAWSGRGASLTSARPLTSNCQVRVSTGSDRACREGAAAAALLLGQAPDPWRRPARASAASRGGRSRRGPRRRGRGRRRCRAAASAPPWRSGSRPPITASKRSMIRARSARPSMARTPSAPTWGGRPPSAAPWAIAWSSSDSASRTEPSAARAMTTSASSSISTPSRGQMDFEMRHHHVGLDAAQVEALAARPHRHRHLVDLGGGEQELDVVRRLLERLQQPVEGRLRQHVDLVDDVDLGPRHHGPVARALDQLAHVVDAGMRGGVHLDHVDVARFDDGLAMGAEAGHADRRRVDRRRAPSCGRAMVVQRPRHDARRRGLADAAHAATADRPGGCATGRRHSTGCGPAPPGRSGRRNGSAGICGRGRGNCCRATRDPWRCAGSGETEPSIWGGAQPKRSLKAEK